MKSYTAKIEEMMQKAVNTAQTANISKQELIENIRFMLRGGFIMNHIEVNHINKNMNNFS